MRGHRDGMAVVAAVQHEMLGSYEGAALAYVEARRIRALA